MDMNKLFTREPIVDLEAHVRDTLASMRARPRMWVMFRADFVADVSTMLTMLGINGNLCAHFHDTKGNCILGLTTPIDDEFAQRTVDKAIRILDEVKPTE